MITSSVIISTNPMANPMVPTLLCFPLCDDGISSSTTTYSIAPAAKESSTGIAVAFSPRNSIVAMAAMGSTSPENAPQVNAVSLLFPSLRSGTDIMAPSGMFWIAIPMESASAPENVRVVLPFITPAKTTPTAIPSGMLCSATARIIFIERGNRDFGPSDLVPSTCWCGMIVSSNSKKQIPAIKPPRTGHALPKPSPACSNAGCSSDQKLAATITPEAKPSIVLFVRSEILLRNMSTVAAPIIVPKSGMLNPKNISIV